MPPMIPDRPAFVAWTLTALATLVAGAAVAQTTEGNAYKGDSASKSNAPDDKPSAQTNTTASDSESVRFSGYIEGYYGWNFGDPSNGITDFRAFDSRHNAVMLLNASLAADWTAKQGYGRLSLQVGTTADTYYASEISDDGSAGTGGHNPDIFKAIQEAYAGTQVGKGSPVKIEAGVFLSPIGPENMAIKDQWNLSRSNLFYAFPFFHLGVRTIVPIGDNSTVTLSVFNGWDSILDKNDQKTIALAFHHIFASDIEVDVQYFVGVERARGAAEGAPLRHLVDAWVKLPLHPRFWILLDFDGGFEAGDLGTSSWLSGGLWTRWQVADEVFLATQSDFLTETRGQKDGKTASWIFFPTDWISSHSLCLEKRFGDFASAKLEFRQDMAASPLYFKGQVQTDLISNAYIANADSQQTLTLALTSWF